ncbi:MAG: L,D-transpeptidase family protein [Aristaeellaceae bacterium]
MTGLKEETMRKYLTLIFMLTLLAFAVALAEQAVLTLHAPEDTVRPGRTVTLSFDAPAAGSARLVVTDAAGTEVSVVLEDYAAVQGYNALWWNGTYQGVPAPEGLYELKLSLNGETATAPIAIGSMAPYLTNITATGSIVSPEQPIAVSFYASVDGSLTIGAWVGGAWRSLETIPVMEGSGSIVFDGAGLPEGEVALTLTLSDATGYPSNEEHINVIVADVTDAETAESDTDEETAESDADALPDIELDTAGDETMVGQESDETVTVVEVVEVIEAAELVTEETSVDGQQVFTPSYGSPYQTDTTLNYWTMPMDITDEAAVWEVLMQPITVLDDGGKKDGQHKRQIVMRAEPSEDSEGVGVVTNLTQSVHVLETGEEWTLVECYSSSFYDSKVKRWNMLVQGYVPTKYLKQVTPSSSMGLVVDKLTQRLYIFKDGALYDTLLCSTGLANAKQPYNETRSGEFLLQNPAVGGWQDGNMVCELGIRFNGGDLMHQVPALVSSSGNKDYSTLAKALGTKASHGCIRVQRNKTPKGTNMRWIWDNREDEIKLLIWEDWQGRQIPIPDDDTVLYYNPNGGSMYHTAEHCYSATKITFQPFTYGQLEEDTFRKLKRCSYCAPPLRVSEIEAINATYAPGGDHDPILTEARLKQMAQEANAD